MSDALLNDITQAGGVTSDLPVDPKQWKRWGPSQGAIDHANGGKPAA